MAIAHLKEPSRPAMPTARTLAGTSARRLGAYYTPCDAASYMARWALQGEVRRALEPSMGEGEFIRALTTEGRRGGRSLEVWGIELAADTFAATIARGVIDERHSIRSDFLAVDPFPVDVVIGNPPYVRLRHLPARDRTRAMRVAKSVLCEQMDPSGSVWMPFVLHACEFLIPGGRLAFVLPYDFTYVRYARPLWRFLSRRFGALRLVRIRERVFPAILQDVVLLLASGHGSSTNSVQFEVYERADNLEADEPSHRATIPVDQIAEGDRPFLEALLAAELRDLLRGRLLTATRPLRELVTFNIGYVTGDKRFFHPPAEVVARYALPASSLRRAITSSRRMNGASLWTSRLHAKAVDRLFLPPIERTALTPGERRYLRDGQRAGIHERYKCAIRDPWYVTPGVKVPALLMSVFSDRPLLVVNDGNYVASNSLLAGYVRDVTPESVAAAWYTTLTLLQTELNVHSLGGGVMIVVPREAGTIRVLAAAADVSHLKDVDAYLLQGNIEDAYRAGDEAVLRAALGLSSCQVDLLWEGVEVLRSWRTRRELGEHVPEDETVLGSADHPVNERVDPHVQLGNRRRN